MHPNDPSLPLLSKQERGQREQIVLEEIARLVDDYLLSLPLANPPTDATTTAFDSVRQWLTRTTADQLFRHALWSTARQYGTRADGRGLVAAAGCRTVRPLHMAVPALPDVVHGSARFARGDTQVVCTVTLGPPRDGAPVDEEQSPAARRSPASNSNRDDDHDADNDNDK